MWTSVSIIDRLIRKFKLQAYPISPDEAFYLAQSIQPVTNINDYLTKPHIDTSGGLDLSGAPGTYVTAFTVPEGKEWDLEYLYKEATTANTSINLVDPNSNNIDLIGVGLTIILLDLAGKTIGEGWIIRANSTGNGGDAARACKLWYKERDAY